MNIAEIEKEIETLENGDTNWAAIQRLSWLYTVHDHLSGEDKTLVYSPSRIFPDYEGEFGEAISGKSIDKVIPILAEHMAVIKLLHAKEYQAVLEKIKEGS